MQPPSPSSTRGAIHRAPPCFAERARRKAMTMGGADWERLGRDCCELWRDCNGRPSASEGVSDAATQTGSGSPGIPVGSSRPAAHKRRLPLALAPASLMCVGNSYLVTLQSAASSDE